MSKKKNRKIVVYDLFGGSQNSVYNALKYFDYFEVYTFDTNPNIGHDRQYVVDLSEAENLYKCVAENNIPEPDFIFASPLCQSFSILLNAGEKGGRVAIKYDAEQDKYVVRDLEEIEEIIQSNNFLNRNNAQKLQERSILGLALVESTIKIIHHYEKDNKELCWYIENPRTSLMWDVIPTNHKEMRFKGFKRLAHYNSYDLSFPRKETYFLANVPMWLKAYNITKNVYKKPGERTIGSSKNETGDRVKIPALLIIDIAHQFKEKHNE